MEKLAKYLASEKLEQKDFAAIVGVHPATICRLLRGLEPRVRLAVKIEKATRGKVKCRDWAHDKDSQ